MVFIKYPETMLPEPEDFGKCFHELFKQPSDNQRKRIEWKKLKKKSMKSKDKRKNKLDILNENGLMSPPEIELPGNASSFAVFASVRLAVLERWMKQSTQEYLQSSCSVPVHDISEIDSDTEDNSQNSTYLPLRVSKIVGLGLRSVFELIRESRSTHPILCTKALRALLDVLQGQTPEGLKSEPPDVIDPLFDLLLDLATLHGPESSVANDGTHLTAIACACLLSLVVVRGDTGKFLSAVAALLMCPRALASQNILMPGVLTSLQRSVHGVLLGKVNRPEWITHGVPMNSNIDSFFIRMPPEIQNAILTPKSLASDGQFLYLYTNRGLFKIGSGYGGTLKAHVYIWKPEFYPNDRGWIGFCNNNLYLKLGLRRGTEVLTIERQGLHIIGTVSLDHRDFNACVIFCDGDNLGTVTPAKDDGFIVRTLNPNTNPAVALNELPLKLARKCIDVIGVASFEEEGSPNTVNTGSDEEVASIVAGKEFGLIRTTTGKVMYCGKASALGIKQAGIRTSRWSELTVTKAPKVIHIAVGHDGLHAVLLTEDGSVFFTGTARRGEDGDQNKARRQPKPVKPKKMIKVDGQFIVHAACNNGSTALVTRDGELLMFGKDTAHADHITGLVCNLKGEFITHVALGKAHAVVLTSKGQVFTFGINNKYQCGRDFIPPNKEESQSPPIVAMDTCAAGEDLDTYEVPGDVGLTDEGVASGSAEDGAEQREHMCPSGRHVWRHEHCMVCTVCRECTGYSISCLTSMRPDRNPGQECGCGVGDSGCAVCGCCRMCARESVDNSELEVLGPAAGSAAPDLSGMLISELIFRVKDLPSTMGRNAAKLQEHLQRRLDERKIRQRKSASGSSKQGVLKFKPNGRTIPVVPNIFAHKTVNGSGSKQISSVPPNTIGKEQGGSDIERDPTRVVCFPPAKLHLSSDSPVIQIACGLHHTVLLLQNGQVYTFGSNQYGQLGCGDILAQAGIQMVKLPCAAIHIAAGSNHTVVLTSKGEVHTFGNYQKSQLGREAPQSSLPDASQPGQSGTSRYTNPRSPWYSIPGPIPNVGPRHGRRATWVGASADQTFLKIDESLINSVSLSKSTVIANKSSIVLLPNQMDQLNSFKCLVINKHDGTCNSFSGKDQVNFCNQTACMDPLYNVLWSYNPLTHEMACYNIVANDIQHSIQIGQHPQQIIQNYHKIGQNSPGIGQNSESNGQNFHKIGQNITQTTTENLHTTTQQLKTIEKQSSQHIEQELPTNEQHQQQTTGVNPQQIGHTKVIRHSQNIAQHFQATGQYSQQIGQHLQQIGHLPTTQKNSETTNGHSQTVVTTDKKILTDVRVVCEEKQHSSTKLINGFHLQSILSAELALPVISNCFVTRLQAAIHLLSSLDTLTVAYDFKMTAVKEEVDDRQMVTGKTYSRDDFQSVNRFESHGGGWGYSGHSIEAIRFMADTDILLGGFGLFGGRGEYTGKIKLLDIGPEGGEQESDGEVLAETDEVPYECGPRQKYPMLFDEPIALQAHRWYIGWCRISGPSSDCGSSGQTMVTTEDQVLFYFKSSKKSNNGTDVNAGQIPQLLYRVITPENQTPTRPMDISEPVYILSKDFSRTVTKECFQSLLSLLQWSWNTFKLGIVDSQQQLYSVLELERLVYISRASLRLIRIYTNEIYPNQVTRKIPLESVHLAESVGDVRALLKQILSDNLPTLMGKKSGKNKLQRSNIYYMNMMNGILEECHHTFVACFHAFYPTAYLKWNCLCDLLSEMDKVEEAQLVLNCDRLLSAVLSALCGLSVRLRSTFPLLSGTSNTVESSLHRGLSPSDNTGLPMMSGSDVHHYPILVEQMSYRSQIEGTGSGLAWSWREVLDRLLNLVTEHVKQALLGNKSISLPGLTRNCCHLLARVVAELVHQCNATDEELQGACGRVLHTTPSRFTRTNQSRTWNTGNGSPDAICFQVDRVGVAIAGVGIYGGLGHYEYELELLEDQSSVSAMESHAHTQRWNNLETVRGSFGPEDYSPDIMEIKFDRPVPIKENVKYAFRLRNHGGRTSNGDGGLNSVKGPDGTTFAFSTCSLSFNGTTQTRGQIPHILYYSNPQDSESQHTSRAMAELQARKCTLSMTAAVVQCCSALFVTARERAEDVAAADILSESCIVNTLLPLVLAHISPLVTTDPRSGVKVLNLIQEMLPHVAALNLMSGSTETSLGAVTSCQESFEAGYGNTTSQHYTWVQSDHPYKPASVSNYRVAFPDAVKWLSLEFDPACGTAQPEDCLQLYVPSTGLTSCASQNIPGLRVVESEETDSTPMPYWPVLHKFSSCSSQWPQSSVILPGNEVIFSLETASDYLKDERANTFGFRCLVVGYEWPISSSAGPFAGLRHLEAELAFLGGMCAASLMKKDLQLFTLGGDEGDVEIAEIVAQQTLTAHGALLSKGLALSSPPTVSQALDGVLPFSVHSNERLFLRDFVGCVAGSSGGRLAQWLQPASRVDPGRCQVLYNREELRCGWPAIVTVLTRDQYGDLVHVSNLKVEVKAVPIDKKELGECDVGRKMRRLSQPDPLTFGGHPAPFVHHPYVPTVRDKMCFHSITIMKPYQNYSFEELRYASPPVKRSSENMLVRPNGDGTYSATWTPASVGCYSVLVNIDGYDMEEVYKVEVREPPQGMTPPTQNLVKKPTHQPSKLRKFVAKNSAGLRIRAHPSLQSEQIGIVHVNGTIAFIDEIHNDDGVWLRLSGDTIKQYCPAPAVEAWCLQYNQHLGKTLLLPVEEPKSILDQVITETILRKLPEIHDRRKTSSGHPEGYQVIKCGASGHNVRSRPSLKAPPVGMLVLGNQIGVTEYIVNSDGCWVLLDQATRDKYCFNNEGDAWSLAMGHNNVLYLGTLSDVENDYAVELQPQLPLENISCKRGFDFSTTSLNKDPESPFMFGSAGQTSAHTPPTSGGDSSCINPFVFGESERPESPKVPRREKNKESKLNILPKWLKGDDSSKGSEKESSRETPSELSGVSVKELVRALGESRANGNGVTPPDTPRRAHSPRGAPSPRPMTRSSSPVAIPALARTVQAQPSQTSSQLLAGRGTVSFVQDSASSSPQAYGSSKSIGISPLVSGAGGGELSARRGSTQSDTSALVSSLTRDLSQSPSQATQPRDLTPSPSGSSIHTRSEASPPHTPNKKEVTDSEQSPRKLMQTGTQTSPENGSTTSIRSHFSIGTSGGKDERVSPKMNRKDRGISGCKSRPKRAISPANMQQMPTTSKLTLPANEPVKQAISPSVAESLRAVFAAFLWHEGIVHDAMACASFLKFHPTLPKKGALVVTRHGHHSESVVDKRRSELTKEERARQRHSVEVSTAGNYLHIQPSTLETLTRSAANANANRNRVKKIPESVIKEDIATDKFSENYHTITVLPPALKCLVFLWEELTTNCLHAIMQQMVISSPMQSKGKKMDKNFAICSKNDAKETRERNATIEKESKKSCRKKKEWKPMSRANYLEDLALAGFLQSTDGETACELCGDCFPRPITYHMRLAHPGCGNHAGGKGYNSGGNFCVGWAGNCGDGGVAGCSWYLVCDGCREKHMKQGRGGARQHGSKSRLSRKKPVIITPSSKPVLSPATSIGAVDTHLIMKNNAMFLLDLASSANIGISSHQRRPSTSNMPSVSENQSPPDFGGSFGPLPPFQCLRTLGANAPHDEPPFYEEVLRRQSFQDGNFPGPSHSGQRPLSEVSLSDNETEATRGLKFHRSVSMGTNGVPWARAGQDGRIIMMRKRNNSSCETTNETGSSLLCNPSTTLQKLIPSMDSSAIVSQSTEQHHDGLSLLQRPVMTFVLQQHDLDALQLAMKQALRKAMCRVYAMQALNWLLRSVTQPVCLHDLLWWFITSLTASDIETETEDDNKPQRKQDDQDINVCEHPLSDITIAGEAVHPLPSTFHSLLQTVADLMVLLPMGSSLQQMAVRCWGLRFTQADHTFLHRSQVFSNISKILSRSEELEDCSVSMHESHQSMISQITAIVECLRDLTAIVEIKASSRQAMVGSLTDGSTETFWESGDEDRNKTKSLTIACSPHHHPKMICLHVDNCRDLANKVSSISFFSGPNSDELTKLRTVEVESRLLGGWVNCPVQDIHHTVIRLELKGPDNSLRVRQIRVLGEVANESLRTGKQYSALTIQQRNCETETLRVFRLITSQVFGKLIIGEQENHNLNQIDSGSASANESNEPLEESNDLREHMVGILFSRSKLTHLQKQVIVHIVQAIRKEAMRVREEWESILCSAIVGSGSSGQSLDLAKTTDTYCFEMLSMVLALSGSSVGRAYLSHQYLLLADLLSLLHTGSARVQRQVTSLLRRMLPEISPESLANVMNVIHLPPADFSIISVANKDSENAEEFDVYRIGILDVFLSVIAKSLSVQVKVKSKDGNGSGGLKGISTVTLATSIHPRDYIGDRWWLRGTVNRKLAEVIIHLLKDMAAGKLSEAWANVTKGAVAENILNLTRLSEDQRSPSVCLHTPTLWLAMASLCVLDRDHVEQLSSGQWSNAEGQSATPRPTCTNHDDGETNAIIQCNMCGNLCADCDRFLHLHRKTRLHQRQVCKEEEEAIKVELHEGCGRTKLFWLLALADARTLKALVEFREGGTRTRVAGASGICRFCGATGNSGLLAIGNVCADHECQEYARTACSKIHNCGHMCSGVQGESSCLPCLHGCSSDSTLRQDADDMCMVCFTEALSCAPALQLKCGHVFHLHCCRAVLMKRWAGPRITFAFSLCPICKANIEHPMLTELLAPIEELYNDVKRKALMRLEYEGLHTTEAISVPGSRFFSDPAGYAMDRYAYYVCYKCNKAYYGGEARCDQEVGENYDPTELVCGACSDVARAQMCPKHGTDFLEYKCRYCCSVAVFFCFGTTHFCNPCHDDFQRVTNLPRNELPSCPAGPKAKQLDGEECPLHVKHPPTGEEFALGCGVCRNAHTF